MKSAYGSLCGFARTLGLIEVASLIDEVLGEEKNADINLRSLRRVS